MRDGSTHFLKTLATTGLLGAALALGGCGGVEFEGKAFDMMGLTSSGERQDEQVADRPPLVMPPKEELPEPGPRAEVEEPRNWPEDPETKRKREMAEAEAEREEYYRKGDWSEDRDIDEFDKLSDDSKRRPGIFGDMSIGAGNRVDPDSGGGH